MKTYKIFAIFAIMALLFAPNAFAQNAGAIVSGVAANAGSAVNGDIGSNNIGSPGFVESGNYQFGPVMNFYGKQAPSVGYQDLRTIIAYACMFSEGSLQRMASGLFETEMVEFKMMNGDDIVAPAHAAADGTRWIKIIVSLTPVEGTLLKGHVSGESRHRSLTMVELLADVALKALRSGANVLHVTAFGATHDVFSEGWGIGFASTAGAIDDLNKGQNRSIVGGGGTGYSSAFAGSRDQGWIQGFGLVDTKLVYPESPKKPVTAEVKTEPAQTGNHIQKKPS